MYALEPGITGLAHHVQGNEDVTLAEAELTGAGAPAALFCVFDGHCGRRAAEQAAQVMRPCGMHV